MKCTCLNFNRFLITLLFCFFGVYDSSGQSVKDSLEQILQDPSLAAGDRILAQGKLATHLFFNDEKERSAQLLDQAIVLSKAQDDKQYLAKTLAIKAIQLRITGNFDESENTMDEASKLIEKIQNPSVKAYVWYARGWLDYRNENLSQAVENFINALQFYGESATADDLRVKASVYNELYNIYAQWNDYSQMKKYAKLGLKAAQHSENIDAVGFSLQSLAYTFETAYRAKPTNLIDLDSALYYYKQSVDVLMQNQDKTSVSSQLPLNVMGLANLYSEFYPETYKDSALYYTNIALQKGMETKQYSVVAGAYGIKSEYAQRENKLDDAVNYLSQAAFYIQMEELPDYNILAQIHLSLSGIYEEKKDFSEALSFYKKYVELYKQRFDSEKMAVASELEVRYESELKEQKLANLNEQIIQRKKLNLIYILLSIAIFIALLFLLAAYRQRAKSLQQQQKLHQLEIDKIKQEHKISVLSAMVDGQENERARIARDLHDGLGGLLSGVKIELSSGLNTLEAQPNKTLLKNTLDRLDQAVDELRRIARNMVPELLLKYGLDEALKEYCLSLKRTGVNISYQVINYQRNILKQNTQVAIYRVAQELINNALKHAKASHILVDLQMRENLLFLTVEDDGCGFDPANISQKGSFGLANLEARLEILNSSLHIDSEQGTGTSVIVNCPID
ncbi:signal transduction histidine kinase [Algoriphagus sp. 4150]|uniref:ATP-binding protein n=1 Tax=Algoriphagus sp. 4150 TaxID=2817756 RepID=UPI002860CD95|nr:sensor histidine kinase [Algoriphagus sp. 4150]MDR7131456.1 signal transduction histidine kinase [Algoriphagus sp. 4150]